MCLESKYFQSNFNENDFIENGYIFKLPADIPKFYLISWNEGTDFESSSVKIIGNKVYYMPNQQQFANCELQKITFTQDIVFDDNAL